MKDFSLVIRPGTITTANFNPLAGKASGVDYEICITHLGTFGTNVKNMIFKTETIKIELGIVEGGNVTPVNSVLKPLKVLSEYDDTDRYTQGKTSGFLYDSEIGKWKRLNTAYDFNYDRNTGTLAFETVKLGATAVAELDKDFFDDIYYHPYETSINNVASVHELKSMGEFYYKGDIDAINMVVTVDLTKLEPWKAAYTMLLNESGGVVDDLIVYRLSPDEVLLVVNAANIEKDFQHILNYLPKEGSHVFENVSDKWFDIAVQGPKAVDILKTYFLRLLIWLSLGLSQCLNMALS